MVDQNCLWFGLLAVWVLLVKTTFWVNGLVGVGVLDEIKAISAFNEVEIEVENELDKN